MHTGNLYLDYFEGGLPPKGDMDIGCIVIRGSSIEHIASEVVSSDCGCNIGFNLGPIIFPLSPTLPCPFLSTTGRTFL